MKGPAIYDFRFEIILATVLDTATGNGTAYQSTGWTPVVVDPVPGNNLTMGGSAASRVTGFPLTNVPVALGGGNGDSLLLGVFSAPIIENGLGATPDQLYQVIHQKLYYGAGFVAFDSATTGPNRGYKYIKSPLSLTVSTVALSSALQGIGPWAADQDGAKEDSLGNPIATLDTLPSGAVRPICNGATIAGFFSNLQHEVELHEGSVSGATSHFSLHKASYLSAPGLAVANVLLREKTLNGTNNEVFFMKKMNDYLRGMIQVNAPANAALDANATAILEANLGCKLDLRLP